MQANTTIAIISIVAAAIAALMIAFVLPKWKLSVASLYIFTGIACVFIWHTLNAFYYLWPSGPMSIIFYTYRYAGSIFYPVAFLLSAFAMTGRLDLCKKRIIALLCIIPTICFLAAATNGMHGLFLLQSGAGGQENLANLAAGPVYYLALIYSYILFICAAGYAIIYYTRAPLRRMVKFLCLVIAAIVPLAIVPLELVALANVSEDVMLLACIMSLVLVLWAEYHGGESGRVLTRDLVFEKLANPIFVLNAGGKIYDMNESAREMWQKGESEASFDTWLALYIWEKEYEVEREDQDTYLVRTGETIRVKRTPIAMGDGKVGGLYVELIDSTAERVLLQQMRRMATVDTLTGLASRSRYEREIARLNNLPSIPFGGIVIDINGLKPMNDTYGHRAGDELIASVGRIIRDSVGTNKNAFSARTGGDEFAIVLEGAGEEEILSYMQMLRQKACSAPLIEGKTVSLSMGWSMRKDGGAADEVMTQADSAMYKDKQEFYRKEAHDRRR